MTRNPTLIRKKFREYFISTFALTLSIYAATIADGIMVGRFLGSNALSVITLTAPVVYFKNIILTIFVSGGNTLAAQFKGRRDDKSANKAFTVAILIGCVFSAALAVIGLVTADPTARLLSRGSELSELVKEYLIPLWLNGPLVLLVNGLASFVRLEGRHRLAMVLPVFSNVVNLILDAVFMKVCGMGIAGAGWATFLGYAAGALLLIPYLVSKKREFRLTRLKKGDANIVSETLKTGAPTSMIHLSNAVATTIINNVVLGVLGVPGANVLSVCMMSYMIGIMFVDGAAQAMLPVGGALYGEKDGRGLAQLFKTAFAATVVITVAISALLAAFPDASAALFSLKSEQALAIFPKAFRLYITCLPFYGITYVLRAFYQCTGRRNTATLLTILDGFLVIVPIMYLISKTAPDLLWLSYAASELISFCAVAAVMQFKAKKTGKRNFLMLDDTQGKTLELTTRNTPDGAVQASEAVMEFCSGQGLDSRLTSIIGVTAEELCVNTFEYAAKKKDTYSDLFLNILDDRVVLKVRDNGVPFNPTEYINDSGEFITGIELVRKIAPDIEYSRVIGFNVTVVTVGF